jgi:ABC-type branched-subunit amino acid transport system substrate-binding protein
MNTKKIAILAIGILIIAGAAAFFSKKSASPSKIKVGVIDVLSGDKTELGINFKKGIEMARDEYVAGHPGSSVELVFEDDAYDAAKGMAAYKKLTATDHVDALIVATSPTINAIYPSAVAGHIPVVTYGTQDVGELKDNVFHIYADPVFADIALGYTLRMQSASSTQDIVGVYTDDQTLVKFYNAFKETLGANINEYPLNLSMKDNPTAIKGIAQKVMAQKPKYVFMTNYANLGSQFIKELRALPGTKPMLVFDLTLNQSLSEYEKTLGDLKILDGSTVVVPEKVDTKGFESKGELADYGYDSLNLLLETKAANAAEWVQNIEKVKTKGVTGSISFDELGRRIPALSIGTFGNGKLPEAK